MKKTLQVINQMQRDGVIGHYAIGGAVGATFYLEPAATLDIDIFVALPKEKGSAFLTLSPIYKYLGGKGFRTEKEYVVIHKWPVQFLPPADDLEEEAIEQAQLVEIEETSARVMTAEHLVAMALKTGRPKDTGRILEFFKWRAVNPIKLKAVLSQHGLEAKWQAFTKKHF
jgi:hypothetical protein